MSKYIFLVCCLISFIPKSFSQLNLSDYSYVIVPEQFTLLNEKDKYQLNSIAEFLFNKYGFHAFKSESAPNAGRCDGLYADLEKVTAILRTKLVVVLKDCNGTEVYRTEPGVSKLKEFKKAYQDALRKAFLSFEELNVRQKEIAIIKEESITKSLPDTKVEVPNPKVEAVKAEDTKVLIPQVVSEEKPVVSEMQKPAKFPEDKFSNYSFRNKSFLLRKTAEGYSLYEESTATEDGLLLIGRIEASDQTQLYFTDSSERVYKASFDASENLIIQKGVTSEVYKRLR